MLKVLLVNNDFDAMSLIKRWLESKSYEVMYTGNKEEVGELIRKFQPHLLLVDILQKEVLEDIKSEQKMPKVPVIMMTGYTKSETSQKVGADDFIEKPFDPHLLQKKIERLIA